MMKRWLEVGLVLGCSGSCVSDPANVGDDAGGTTSVDSGDGSGEAGSESGGVTGGATVGNTGVECPPIELGACGTSRLELAEAFIAAVPGLADEFDSRRAAFAVTIGAPGITDALTLATTLHVVAGTTFRSYTPGCQGTLDGARSMLQTCDPPSVAGGFGCSGECGINELQADACVEQGTVQCFGNIECPGACIGVCQNPVPAPCEDLCVGTCDGACSCVQELGLCTGLCDGNCSNCADASNACGGTCLGLCQLAEAPAPGLCAPEALACIGAGPGVCHLDCTAAPSAPAGTEPCCAELVRIAAALSMTCNTPDVQWVSGASCPEGPPANTPIGSAIGLLLELRRRIELFLEATPDLQSALLTPPDGVEGDPCWPEKWAATQAAVDSAATELGAIDAELTTLIDAMETLP